MIDRDGNSAHAVFGFARFLGDLIERAENTVWVGLNGGQPAEEWDQISQRAMEWRTARQLDEGHADFSGMPERAVLWIDISVIDLGHAAGAVGLNPGGMKPETLVSVIGAMSCNWQAIAITGLAPARDTRGISELAAIETLNAALRADPAQVALWALLAFTISYGLQAATLLVLRRTALHPVAGPLAIGAGNRNIALSLVALPPETIAPILIFIGCWQLPMYLTPVLLPPLYRKALGNG